MELENIELKCASLGTRCDVCNEVPTGFSNTFEMKLGEKQIKICDDCLEDLEKIISIRY